MKKTIFFLILIFATFGISAQEYRQHGKGKTENGIKVGEWKYYYFGGELEYVGKYINGKETGEWKCFYENGQLEYFGRYKDGRKTGEWIYYDEIGGLLAIVQFKNGDMFEMKNYDSRGKLISNTYADNIYEVYDPITKKFEKKKMKDVIIENGNLIYLN